MSNSKNNQGGGSHNESIEKRLERLFIAFWKITLLSFNLLWEGLKKVRLTSIELRVYGLSLLGVAFGLTYKHRYVYWIYDGPLGGFWERWILNLKSTPWVFHYPFILAVLVFLVLIGMGIGPYRERREFQKKLDELNLKSGQGCSPKIISVQKLGQLKTRLVVQSKGVGLDTYRTKMSALSTSFNSIIESITVGSSPQFMELLLTDRVLPKRVDSTLR